MGTDGPRAYAYYFTRRALDVARAGRFGRSWVYVVQARPHVASLKDARATALLREVEKTFHRRDHRRVRAALAGLAEYLA